MKRVTLLLVIAAMMLGLGCASTLGVFKEPTSENTMLVIGQIIVEDDYYSDETGVTYGGLEVAIVGKTNDGKELGIWTKSDEKGYFALADVPMGEYAIKGVRGIIGRPSRAITVTNRLRLSTDPYRVENAESPVQFTAQYFPFEPKGRIQSLQHTVFKLDKMSGSTGQTKYVVKPAFTDYKLVDGTVLNEGPVEEYFIEKYPESAWTKYLEEVKTNTRFRR